MKMTSKNTANEILESLGVKTIGRWTSWMSHEYPVFWEYKGIRISRPPVQKAYIVLKEKFGIDCKLLK